jgi:hypothetical protein
VAPAKNHSQPDGHSESFSGSHLGLTITSTPQGRFVYWKGFEPSELLNYDSLLVAFIQELPFQEGRPLSPIEEEGESSTELLGHSRTASHLLDRQVCMASLRNTEEDDLDPQYDNEQLANVSADEPRANAPKMKMRSTVGSCRQRTPSALNAGATRRIAPAYQGILTILLQQSRIASTIRRLAPSQKQHC